MAIYDLTKAGGMFQQNSPETLFVRYNELNMLNILLVLTRLFIQCSMLCRYYVSCLLFQTFKQRRIVNKMCCGNPCTLGLGSISWRFTVHQEITQRWPFTTNKHTAVKHITQVIVNSELIYFSYFVRFCYLQQLTRQCFLVQ